MQGRCGPAGHLSGEGKLGVSEDYSWLPIVPSEEILRKPWYIRTNPKKGRFRRTLRAVFKFLRVNWYWKTDETFTFPNYKSETQIQFLVNCIPQEKRGSGTLS